MNAKTTDELTYEEIVRGSFQVRVADIMPCVEVLRDLIIEAETPEARRDFEEILKTVLDQTCPF